jgi:23S rRNA (adenine2503-C2)-methyltransferase
MSVPELEILMSELGEPQYRAKQLFVALTQAPQSLKDISTLPKALKERLTFIPPVIQTRQESKDGTQKLLFQLEDTQCVESVLLRYKEETTICVSSQVGCAQGCVFCVSALGGLVRNLTPGEIVGQVLYCQKEICRIVFMGMGEPLANLSSVLKAIELLSSTHGKNLSKRHITVSTCGLVPEMRELAEYRLPITLSVSLHAPDDLTRSQLMPINRKYPLEEVFSAAREYFEKSGRRISLEYVMIEDVNDTAAQGALLVRRLKGLPAHINLIRLNPGRGEYRPSSEKSIRSFAGILETGGIPVSIRRSLGSDIDAACGQLRKRNGISK